MPFLGRRAREISFDLCARGLDQFSVVDAGRARGHAGHAPEAAIEMADPFGVDLRRAFPGKFHQIDTAARRIHFLVPKNVSGTCGETEAAVHTLVDDRCGGWMVRVEGGGNEVRRSGHGEL